MATLVGIFNMTHSPFCYMPPEKWNDVRASRFAARRRAGGRRAANRAKAARISLVFTACALACRRRGRTSWWSSATTSSRASTSPTSRPSRSTRASRSRRARERDHREAVGPSRPLGLAPAHRADVVAASIPPCAWTAPSPSATSATPSSARPESLTDLTTAIVPIFVNATTRPSRRRSAATSSASQCARSSPNTQLCSAWRWWAPAASGTPRAPPTPISTKRSTARC